jgi:hypothetical protein
MQNRVVPAGRPKQRLVATPSGPPAAITGGSPTPPSCTSLHFFPGQWPEASTSRIVSASSLIGFSFLGGSLLATGVGSRVNARGPLRPGREDLDAESIRRSSGIRNPFEIDGLVLRASGPFDLYGGAGQFGSGEGAHHFDVAPFSFDLVRPGLLHVETEIPCAKRISRHLFSGGEAGRRSDQIGDAVDDGRAG